MIERDMEELIARFPNDFFPRQQLQLKGRQESLAGVGRFDLVFSDKWGSTILMELKARSLKYEDATQVATYRDELKRNGHKNIVMWLVAVHVPRSVREFLDSLGIEHTEIHVAEFRGIAERHDFPIKDEEASEKLQMPTTAAKRKPPSTSVRKRSSPLPGLSEAKKRLISGWNARNLAEALNLSKANAYRRIVSWTSLGSVGKTANGKRGRKGGLAKYEFLENNREQFLDSLLLQLLGAYEDGRGRAVDWAEPRSVVEKEIVATLRAEGSITSRGPGLLYLTDSGYAKYKGRAGKT
jgi:hypothetical protein